ncbi:MAG TPA: DUF1841 family protein [Gammaproteobacteria bacterium]|nr:DUF1841 family protein [Gammaproteobacteria bacterium]
MLFGQDRDQLRRFYCEVWRKHQTDEALEPLEIMVRDVIADHPEYHRVITDSERALGREYLPETGETNPFLHMGMHIAIQEQLGADRPAGIRALYQRLLARTGDAHATEHRIMDCLGEMIWQAQRAGTPPDEAAYLGCLRRLADGA